MGTNTFKRFCNSSIKVFLSSFVYIILGFPILIAGIIKFTNPSNFASSLTYTYYFPDWMSIIIAISIPGIEIILGASLIFNFYRNISIIIYRLLLICFLVFHIWNNFVSVQKPCNCFGNLVEFNGIWMMIIILVLLFISIVFVKPQGEKKSFSSIQLNINKKNIILMVIVVVLFLTAGYVRWQRIERELKSGLIAHSDLPEVQARIHSIYDSYFPDLKNNKDVLLLFLRGKSCSSCLDELEFWIRVSDKINIVCIFPEIPDYKKKYELELKYPFKVVVIPKDIFFDIIGKYPASINRIFLPDYNSPILIDAATDSYDEKISFLRKIEEAIK